MQVAENALSSPVLTTWHDHYHWDLSPGGLALFARRNCRCSRACCRRPAGSSLERVRVFALIGEGVSLASMARRANDLNW